MMNPGASELTEHVTMRLNPLSRLRSSRTAVRFLVRIDLKKCDDGKYRIYRSVKVISWVLKCEVWWISGMNRQEDNFPSDLTQSGFAAAIPGMGTLNTIVKSTAGFTTAKLGRFLLAYGWFGPWKFLINNFTNFKTSTIIKTIFYILITRNYDDLVVLEIPFSYPFTFSKWVTFLWLFTYTFVCVFIIHLIHFLSNFHINIFWQFDLEKKNSENRDSAYGIWNCLRANIGEMTWQKEGSKLWRKEPTLGTSDFHTYSKGRHRT